VKLTEVRKLETFADTISPMESMTPIETGNGRSIPEGFEPHRRDGALEQIERDQQMEELFGQLSQRDADIVRYRYGLDDGSAHTLEETGRRFDLTRERIRQIEKDVMRRLREFAGKNKQDYIHS
jgi:DNA-directed RNA polymerase sigma subunit (sigma70/sigma32)